MHIVPLGPATVTFRWAWSHRLSDILKGQMCKFACAMINRSSFGRCACIVTATALDACVCNIQGIQNNLHV